MSKNAEIIWQIQAQARLDSRTIPALDSRLIPGERSGPSVDGCIPRFPAIPARTDPVGNAVMTSNEWFRQLTIQHSDCLDQIQKEWQRADETMLEFQIAGMGRETGGYEKIAAHERGMACRLVTDYHDRVIMPLLPHVDELLQRELIAFADRLYEEIKDPRKPWSSRYRERRLKLDRLLGARVQAEEIVARAQAQQSTQQDAVSEPAALPHPHVGDDLLRFLSGRPQEMAALVELPERFHDANMLTVSDADGLIEFGERKHCWVGPVGNPDLRVEEGWDFGSITGPDRKPMKQFIAEALSFTGDDRIRPHVRPTAKGRVWAARLTVDRTASQVEQKPKTTATDWRDVQRRLYELYERGDVWPKYDELERRLGCSRSTIRKAIKPPDGALNRLEKDERKEAVSIGKKLAGWQARHTKGKRTHRASSLTEVHLDNTAQTREQNPAEAVTLDDPEEVLAHLIQDAEPKVRAKLNAITPKDVQDMTGDQVRQMAEMIANDPDKYDRVMGRAP